MMTTEKMYSAPETAYFLRTALGPHRAWDDALADMRAHKTNVCGLVLIPAVELHDGKGWRPHYAASAIREFVVEVSKIMPDFRPKLPPQGQVIDYDDNVAWRMQRLKVPAIIH